MRVIAILEVDEDKVLDAHAISTGCGIGLDGYDSSLEAAVEGELGWASESGISTIEIITPDSLNPNDTDLGNIIRTTLNS